jgi:hypothetical protein
MRFILPIIIILVLAGCKASKDGEFEQKTVEPDPFKRAKEAAEKGGGIFNLNKRDQEGQIVNFATSNVMWRATLKSLNFLPLLNADYAGGVIITDWYSENLNSKDSVKLTIRFLSNELRSDSIEIIAHKKNCITAENCKVTLLAENFSREIRDSIINNARALKIEEEKKKK